MTITDNEGWKNPDLFEAPKAKKKKKAKRKKKKAPDAGLRTFTNRALLPNGLVAQKVSARRHTHALCAPQISGRDNLWVVLKWGCDGGRLRAEGVLRDSQTNGERKTVIVPVVSVKR